MKQYFNSAKSGLNGLGDQTSRFGEQVYSLVGTVYRLKFLYWVRHKAEPLYSTQFSIVIVTGCMTKTQLDNVLLFNVQISLKKIWLNIVSM